MNSSADTHMLERKPACPWKFYPGAMWKTWQPPEIPLRFSSPVSYNASGLVLFFCSDWKKNSWPASRPQACFYPDWCCLVKPGFLARKEWYACTFAFFCAVYLFYSNTGPYIRVAVIKYVHVTPRECYKYIYFSTAFFMISLHFCLLFSDMYRWATTETTPKPLSQSWTGMLKHLVWWRQQQSCDGSSGVSHQEAAGLQEQEALAKTYVVWVFLYQSLHLTVFFATLSKKLNLKGNIRNQPG